MYERAGEAGGGTTAAAHTVHHPGGAPVIAVLLLLAGSTLLVFTWLSVLRTVFVPRRRSSLLMRLAVRTAVGGGAALARRLPPSAGERVLDLCAPLALMVVGGCWAGATFLGAALLSPALAGIPPTPREIARFMVLRDDSGAALLAVAGWFAVLQALLVFGLHLYRVTAAYSRRERTVAELSMHSLEPSEAEFLLAEHLRFGSRDHLDDLFRKWTAWLADIKATHTGYPALTCFRPATELCWLDAAVLVLDAAALTHAVAPAWAPHSARSVLDAGSTCLPALARQLGIDLPRPAVSLQGREERGFEHSVRVAVLAGLPEQRGYGEAWAHFQHWRTRYAPQAAAMRVRLRYSHGDDELAVCRVGHAPA
ncbi:hypothetical protein M8542_31725 [Amycolatopsis sp. OK19-0408]|uniref:Uncharacterized protein n=1 Tax=Amycolatopsis iheyensis TaxID=2945988 RepID=A0A9X2NM79_9PSEU|nr:hypothetical protein [Amycolatopsis iheyensis]MCR6487410.1 hypothetical protein [Amycolatopsis iheyensis]